MASSKPSRGDRGGGGRDVQLSKSLSWLCRHGAPKEGITVHSGGFLIVDDVLRLKQFRNFTVDDVRRVVESNAKQRFALEEEPQLMIRANQGHSFEVPDLALEPILSADEAPVVVHGTYLKAWPAIKERGLSKMSRTHVHFSPKEPDDDSVISGMRASCQVLIYINMSKALADGLEFFKSANDVILCAGDKDGCIAPRFFERAVQRSDGSSLL
ncbi:tRNA 2'-phosphotransferase 1-like [Sycon ciliatum]|uniref:tRNA 2'-phosphotransferase 1-like n=1 Tax=Sycon ciliatum TaxID=27933 RepID=UPI0020A8EDBB